MADTVKEIFAGTVSVSDIAADGSKVLVTTDAATQYVIKDVNVSSKLSSASSPTLKINGFDVALVSSPVSGSEVVDVSSTVSYAAYPSAPTLTQESLWLLAVGPNTAYRINIFAINGDAAQTNTLSADAVSSLPAANTLEYARATDGSIFYVQWDGNSSTTLYKRAGGINGSESQVVSLTYAWIVFDGVDTYYQGRYTESTLYKYNINTGVTTTVNTGFTLAGTSYPSASMVNNGMILVNPSGNGQTDRLWILNPVTGASTQISGLADVSVSGNNYKISGYYNAATNRYTLYKRFGSTLYRAQLSGAVTVGSPYSNGLTNSQFTIGSIGNQNGNYNCGYVSVTDTKYSVARHNVTGKTELTVYDTSALAATTIPWLSYQTNMDTILSSVGSTPASSFTVSIPIRVTGVKITL